MAASEGCTGVFPASEGSLATRRHQLAHRLAGPTQPRAVPGTGRRAWPQPSPARRSTLVGGIPHSSAGGGAFSGGPGVSAWRCLRKGNNPRLLDSYEAERKPVDDSKGEVAARYGSIPAAYLIRPDGYVGFRCNGGEVSTHLPQYLTELLGRD